MRVAVVGLGAMGANHARVWRDIDGVDLVGVADSDPQTRGRLARYHGVPGRESIAELLQHDRPDALSIAVPTSLHEDAVREAAAAGVHVLVEKPLAADTASATRIADVVKQAGIVAMVGHIERFNPALVEMRKLLDTNTLGELFAFTARRIGPFPPRVKDVGVTHDIATHDLDQARHVLRKPMTTLFARSARRVHEEREDLISIVGSTDDGVVLTFEVNWLTPRKQRETVVLGENGMLLADTIAQDLFFFRNNWQEGTWLQVLRGVDEGDMTRYALKRTEPLRAELTAFATAVRSGSAIEPTVEDGLAAIQLADAVLRSSQSGRPWHAWTKEL